MKRRNPGKAGQLVWESGESHEVKKLEGERTIRRGHKGRGNLKRVQGINHQNGKDPLQLARLNRHFDFSDLKTKISEAKELPRFVKTPKISPELMAQLELEPGKAYTVRWPLDKMICQDHFLPFLERVLNEEAYVPAGTMIMYLGKLELEERTGKNVSGGIQRMCVDRHVFLYGNIRFFMHDLNSVQPL